MLSDQQFESLLERISINQQDRDRLIRIETIVTLNQGNSANCKADVAAKIATIHAATTKAHERIDEVEKGRYRLAGAVAAIAVAFVAIEMVLKLTNKI